MLRTIHQQEIVVGIILGLLLLCVVTLITTPLRPDIFLNSERSAASIQTHHTLRQSSLWRPNNILKAASPQLSWSRIQKQASMETDMPPQAKLGIPSYVKKLNQSQRKDAPSRPADLGLGDINFSELEQKTVVVVGLSKSTERDGVGLIGSVHIHMPFVKIIIYDLGMSERAKQRVRQLCNVELRTYDFSVQPSHVKMLRTHAWRLLVFVDCLLEYGSCFMAHPKIRFRAPLSTLFPYINQTRGVFSLIEPDLTIFQATHPAMLDYFRVEKRDVGSVREAALLSVDGFFVIMNSSALSSSLPNLRTCAQMTECISPHGSSWKGVDTKRQTNTQRHHYAMSAISAELYKAYGATWAPFGEVEKKIKRIYTKIDTGNFGLELMWAFQCNPLKNEFLPSIEVR